MVGIIMQAKLFCGDIQTTELVSNLNCGWNKLVDVWTVR